MVKVGRAFPATGVVAAGALVTVAVGVAGVVPPVKGKEAKVGVGVEVGKGGNWATDCRGIDKTNAKARMTVLKIAAILGEKISLKIAI